MNRSYAYFPGCLLRGPAAEYAWSLEAVFDSLGFSLRELPNWNCCGGTSASFAAGGGARALSERNLSQARRLGLPLLAPCAVGYSNLRMAALMSAGGASAGPPAPADSEASSQRRGGASDGAPAADDAGGGEGSGGGRAAGAAPGEASGAAPGGDRPGRSASEGSGAAGESGSRPGRSDSEAAGAAGEKRRGSEGAAAVVHPLELLSSPEVLEELRSGVVERLEGLRVACYYGCRLVRPSAAVAFEDPADPRSMERCLEAVGAETVEWGVRTRCCSAALSLPAGEVAGRLIGEILERAQEAGANAVATACPVCQLNLDLWQYEVSKRRRRKIELPVFHFTELLALALDLRVAERCLKRHVTSAFALLDELFAFDE